MSNGQPPRRTESPAVIAVISAASIAYVSLPLLVMGTALYVAFFSHLHWFLRLVAGIACVPLLTVIGAVIVAIFAAGLKSVNTPAQPPKFDDDGQPIDRR